jgi:molybdopterin/thiamine biosynthesis adenylyltransferase
MFKFTPQTIPNNIFVIGGGGTGSRLIPLLSQFMRSITRGLSPTGWVESPTIWLIDDDIVEAKNLLRQNFIKTDIGKHKAVVLAERYSRAYDTDIIPLVMRVGNDNSELVRAIKTVLTGKNPTIQTDVIDLITKSIVISCVDSASARRSILNSFVPRKAKQSEYAPHYGAFFIDAGNEDNFGQVNFFHPVIMALRETYDCLSDEQKFPKLIGSIADIEYIPMDLRYYRDMVDTESTASCADLNQTLAINALMATTIIGIVQNFYYRKSFTHNCVRLSLDGANSTEYNTWNYFRRVTVDSSEISVTDLIDIHCFTTEKDGSKTYLEFTAQANLVRLTDRPYNVLKQALANDEKLRLTQERERAHAEAEAKRMEAEVAKAEKIKSLIGKQSKKSTNDVMDVSVNVNPSKNVSDVMTVSEISNASNTGNRPRRTRNGTTTANVSALAAVAAAEQSLVEQAHQTIPAPNQPPEAWLSGTRTVLPSDTF